jgi:hypothetical protein
MRRFGLVTSGLVLALAFASQAMASTSVSVSMTFAEPATVNFKSDCPVFPEGACGSGEVIPFGHATETIDFGAGCGGACDLRTIDLAQGSIFIEETFSDFACRGSCHPSPVFPFSGKLTEAQAIAVRITRAGRVEANRIVSLGDRENLGRRHIRDLGLRVDELPDQPRTGNPVGLGMRAGNPFHWLRDPPMADDSERPSLVRNAARRISSSRTGAHPSRAESYEHAGRTFVRCNPSQPHRSAALKRQPSRSEAITACSR